MSFEDRTSSRVLDPTRVFSGAADHGMHMRQNGLTIHWQA